MKFLGDALTFDDVLLVPGPSEVLPNEVDTTTYLTKNIKLNIPMMSAGMDTVTESQMAIAMARQGGIGIIHKNMPIAEQARQVDVVKRSEHGVITDPFYLHPDNILQDALDIMANYRISGVPIVDKEMYLKGILTNRDVRFEEDPTVQIDSIMTRENLVVGYEGIKMKEAIKLMEEAKIEKLPIVDNDYKLKGLITIKDIEKSKQYPNSARDENNRLLVGAAVGITNDMFERVEALVDANVDVITVDTAHGHSKNVLNAIKNLKEKYPDLQIIAGNVATAEATRDLIDANAMQVHLNLAQELVMKEGDNSYHSSLELIEKLVNDFDYPIIVKETGSGISKPVAKKLIDVGVKYIDVAGKGGTNFIEIEDLRDFEVDYSDLYNWGIPTAKSIIDIRSISDDTFIIASGGVRTAMDLAKSIIIGADMAAMTGEVLNYLLHGGYDARESFLKEINLKLKIIMALLGVRNIDELKNVDYKLTGELKELIEG
ncbi:MAG: IMP dehydrogenase [Anaerococcus sp.]|nr:IMP dehydrogenase [Anaerococcus sp.]